MKYPEKNKTEDKEQQETQTNKQGISALGYLSKLLSVYLFIPDTVKWHYIIWVIHVIYVLVTETLLNAI